MRQLCGSAGATGVSNNRMNDEARPSDMTGEVEVHLKFNHADCKDSVT